MDIFNMELPEENKDDKLNSWFDFMNNQMQKLEQTRHELKVNSILDDNNIETL